jgi:hypothetical protein
VSLNIGNVLKAQEEGRWVKVPAVSGEFALKLKPFLPGEQYALSEKIKAASGDIQGVGKETLAAVASHIIDWRDLLDSDGTPIPHNAGLLADEKFLDALMGLTMIGGGYLLSWIISKINKSDTFTEEADTSFLAST